jgi:hypothetical protein
MTSQDWTDENQEIKALREKLKQEQAQNMSLILRNAYLEDKLRDIQTDVQHYVQQVTDELSGINPAHYSNQITSDETI